MGMGSPHLSSYDTNLLRNVPLFQQLAPQTLDTLLTSATVRTLERGTELFVQSEPADRFFVLLEGWVKLYRVNREGAEAVVSVVAAGESFAEGAMFAGIGFPVNAQAVTDIRLLTITAQAFIRSLQADTGIAMAMLGSLSLRLRHLIQQIEHLQVQTSPQRIGNFLLRFCPPGAGNATFSLPFDKGLLAKRLGMQPETFSRALSKLRAVGVETHGSLVMVADLQVLREFCHAEDLE